ncbi:MAG: carbohydrate-binding protein [Halieaceae bacterium]|nr:carbohydrate-binding protein [Halieaceae bacterium]
MLVWDPVDDSRLEKYVVSEGAVSGNYSVKLDVKVPATELALPDRLPNRWYYWAVQACGTDAKQGFHCSDYSNEVSWFDPVRLPWAAPVDVLSSPVYSALFDKMLDPDGKEIDGEGVTYSDSSAGRDAIAFRFATAPTYPDLWPVGSMTEGPGLKIGSTAIGEWQEYSITVKEETTVVPKLLYAGASATGRMRLEVGVAQAEFNLPPTGAWTNWVTATGPEITLPAGSHKLRMTVLAPGSDWYSLAFEKPVPFVPLPKPKNLRARK